MLGKLILIGLSAVSMAGCTYNVSMSHSEGQASDVIDSAQEASPDITPEINASVQSPNSAQSITPKTAEAK
jgi:uncharacterized lipoprotein